MTLICSSVIAIPLNDTPTESDTIHHILFGKHWSLFNCSAITFEPGDYELFPNRSVHIKLYNLTLNESYYVLRDDAIFFCAPKFPEDENHNYEQKIKVDTTWYLTLIGLSISMVCLLIHLIVFLIVPDQRNMSSWSLAALCVSLFCSYFFLLVISIGEITQLPTFCTAVAFLTHLFLLASVLWMSIMSYDAFMMLLQATGRCRGSRKHFSLKRFGCYCLFSFGIALLFSIAGLLADVLDVVPLPYKPEYNALCWFSRKTPLLIFFAGPVIALTCVNFILFILSFCTIYFNKMEKQQGGHQSIFRGRYMMYFRLSVIMGVTWIVGILANVANAHWLWFIFVLLNTFQGFFIFIAFTCSKKVKDYFLDKIAREHSFQKTFPSTLQTYSFYEISSEKEKDKITDTINEKTGTLIEYL